MLTNRRIDDAEAAILSESIEFPLKQLPTFGVSSNGTKADLTDRLRPGCSDHAGHSVGRSAPLLAIACV